MLHKQAQWLQDNLPAYHDDFMQRQNRPAPEDKLVQLENRLGTPLPTFFRQSYLYADGMKRHPDCSAWRLLSLAECQAYHEAMVGFDVVDEFITEFRWHAQWLPFALHRFGDFLCLNLIPDDLPDGQVEAMPFDFATGGGVFEYRHEENCVVARAGSLSDWLADWQEEIQDFLA